MRERLLGRHADIQTISLVLLFGCLLLVLGLDTIMRSKSHEFTLGGALDGIASQISVTGPAAVLMGLATLANVFLGAVVLRLLGAPPFRSFSDLVLGGFATAVVLDSGALFLLGSAGLFRWPVLAGLHLAAVAFWVARRNRLPLLQRKIRFRAAVPGAWWLLIGAIWAGPLIVQLASPAVPFMDVLPNHVAPVEHVRVFGSFETLTTSPSPIYGPSRLMLGYVGLLGELTTIVNLEAILAVAAFALPLTILTAISVRQLATALFGRVAGFWIMLTFPLTFTFVRLPDARATVVVFPLAAWALASLAHDLRLGTASDVAAARAAARPDLGLIVAFGAAVLVHPLVGLIAVAAALVAFLVAPARLGPRLIPALGGAAMVGLPQGATMLGLGLPAWTGLVCLAAALPVAYALALLVARVAVPWNRLGAVGATAALLALLFIARPVLPKLSGPLQELSQAFPLLSLVCVLGVLLSARIQRTGWTMLGCGVVAGLAAWVAAATVPTDTLFQRAIHYEVPKAVEYWLPVMLALGAAAGLAAVYRWLSLGVLRLTLLAAFVVVSVFPLTGPIVQDKYIGEHRGAESLGLALREAERGFWVGYHDPRRIINATDQQVVDAIRAEGDAGRLTPSTRVLHIASSFQQWLSVPIGVFNGVIETSISLRPEVSIHTDGGRLLGFDVLDRELASDYGYVVVEAARLPAELAASLPGSITAAGYHEVWSNSTAVIYARN
jgi:hypothetical protein